GVLSYLTGCVIQQLLVAAIVLYTLQGACQACYLTSVLRLLGYFQLPLYLLRFLLTERLQWLARQRWHGAERDSYQ
ncbi:hypothetical protein R0J93_24390, partial [Pseudoalteromonas sp. SIMBA_148]